MCLIYLIDESKLYLAVYPRTYDPTFATGACVLAIIFASTFSLIFPLIGPAVVVLLFLTLIGTFSLKNPSLSIPKQHFSSPLSYWLCLRTDTFTNWRSFADLAFAKIRYTSRFPAILTRTHIFE